MRYQITHQTTYTYSNPVTLAPHRLRLRPRCDVNQRLHHFALTVTPEPLGRSQIVDLDGNALHQLWFAEEPVTALVVTTVSDVETYCTNPFAYLLDPWAVHLPLAYPSGVPAQLLPYLAGYASTLPGAVDPIAAQLAQEVWYAVSGNTVAFLSALNQRIYESCGYTVRETGVPYPPGITWSQKAGSCRDLTVLFMEACRAMGLAARFVSGYQEGDTNSDDRHLHAWAEIYLPGGGWRGFDPTHGLAVSDRHIALVASPHPQDTAPISGTLRQGGVRSDMTYQLTITGHTETDVPGDQWPTDSSPMSQSMP